MGRRFIICALFILISICILNQDTSAGEHNSNNITPPMTIISEEKEEPKKPRYIDPAEFNLACYEAAVKNDLSVCKQDQNCLTQAGIIQGWACSADICKSTKSAKNLFGCFKKLPDADPKALAAVLCSFHKSPNAVKRKEFLQVTSLDPYFGEDDLVQLEAHVRAIKGSGDECINYIKNYKGPYGPNWEYKWYRILAGCRILSGEMTRREQEKNFSSWYNWGLCEAITDQELRSACEVNQGGSFFDD